MTSENKRRCVSVFFDLDGTLLDTTYLHTFAWWRALGDAYQQVPMAAIQPLIGMGSGELLTTLIGGDDPAISKAHGRYFATLHEFIRPLPGGRDLVRQVASKGARVVIVTAAKKRDLPALLGPLGCVDIIADTVHGEMAGRSKPSPDLFSLALERSGCGPEETLALGDSIWDIEAANRAGIGCVAVETGGTDAARLATAGALAVYKSCAEIVTSWGETPFSALIHAKEAGDHPPRIQEKLVS